MRNVMIKSSALLLTAWLSIVSVPALANVGKVLYSIGVVTVEKPAISNLRRGDALEEGDVIVTGPKAYVQLRMADGTKFAIRPDSRFTIEAFEAPATASEPAIGAGGSTIRASFNLERGALRSLSGSLAKRAPDTYQVSTPSAVIRVRGTDWSLGTDVNGGTFAGTSQGATSMSNAGGDLDLPAGGFGFAANFTTPPVRITAPPQILQDAGTMNLEEAEEENEESSDGGRDGGPGGEAEGESEGSDDSSAAEGGSGEGSGEGGSGEGGSGEGRSGEGSGEGSNDGGSGEGSGEGGAGSGGSSEGGSGDGGAGSGGSEQGGSGQGGSGQGGSGPGGSGPGGSGSAGDGGSGPGSSGPSAPGGSGNAAGGGASGAPAPVARGFSGAGGVGGVASPATGTGPIGTGPVGPVGGASTATEPVQTITTVGSADGGNSNGPVDLTDGSDDVVDQALFEARGMAFAVSGRAVGINTNDNTDTFDASGAALTGFDEVANGSTTSYAIGTASNQNVGFDATSNIRWGRWAQGVATQTTGGTSSDLDLGNESLHWVIVDSGETVPTQAITGSASYTLVGNTDPTDNLGNVGVLGSANFSADFTNNTVSSSLQLGINGQNWNASGGTGQINANLFNGLYGTVSVNGASGGSGTFGGAFGGYGSGGIPTGAGMTYQLTNGTTTVSGAAVFNTSNANQ